MFIVVKKIHSRRLIAGAFLLLLTLALAGTGAELTFGTAPEARSAAALPTEAGNLRSNEDRVAYLTRLGWEVRPEPASVDDVLIPKTFDESYDSYLALQREQGFDLTPYAGKTVKRYTYQLLNFPGLQENVWASLLLSHKTLIAGEVYCSSGDGFTQGLAFPGRES